MIGAGRRSLFLGALVVWILWALYICHGAVPGLLDDGIHLIHSDRYRTDGFFATVACMMIVFVPLSSNVPASPTKGPHAARSWSAEAVA